MPSEIAFLEKIRVSLRALRELGLSFRGPFITPQENCIYVVGRRILTVDEVAVLCKDGRLADESDLPVRRERGTAAGAAGGSGQ